MYSGISTFMKRIILLFLICGLVVFGCTQPEPPVNETPVNETPDETPQGTLKGVSLSPRTFEGDDFIEFFEKAEETGEIVMWAGDWNDLTESDFGAAGTTAGLASVYDYIPLIEVTTYTQGEGELIRPFTEETKEAYKNGAVEFAKEYQPKYLGLGIEINAMYEKSPDDFEEFVVFYNEVYDDVKAVSPNTKIFVVFQLEKMKGLPFWSDGIADENETHWHLLDEFKSDLAVFTTYPGLVYKDPSDIPSDHYTEIKSHTTKPIAFTEIGWHAAASPQGWESSDAEQAEFVTKFFDLTEDLEMELIIWSFLYDPDTIEPFDSMGLRRSDGTARPSWDIWVNAPN